MPPRKKTEKRRKLGAKKVQAVVIETLLEILTAVKMYHWKTQSYSQHKATDELYGRLNDDIDQFIEVLLGKEGGRPSATTTIRIGGNEGEADFRRRIHDFRKFLTVDVERWYSGETDLLTIRDEILLHLNQFLYLMTFDR